MENLQPANNEPQAILVICFSYLTNKRVYLDVEPTDTIGSLKRRAGSVHVRQQARVYLGNKLLKDDLSASLLSSGSFLYIGGPKTLRLTIKSAEGSAFRIDEQPDFDVLDLKWHINYKLGNPVKQQRLYLNGDLLQNAKTLAESGVRDGDTLHLALPLRS